MCGVYTESIKHAQMDTCQIQAKRTLPRFAPMLDSSLVRPHSNTATLFGCEIAMSAIQASTPKFLPPQKFRVTPFSTHQISPSNSSSSLIHLSLFHTTTELSFLLNGSFTVSGVHGSFQSPQSVAESLF